MGFAQSNFFILVGAVDKLRGKHASYSLPGSALFVCAPGGDRTTITNHVTAALNGQCQDAGAGTSFACPVVSGVAALVLQARPELTWRDVQGIFAVSSKHVDDSDDTSVVANAAGYWHSDYYGFGIVDALASVKSALDWTLLPEEVMLATESGWIDEGIADNASVTTTSCSLKHGKVFTKSVQVLLQLKHVARGHLEIALVGPSGTRSILNPGRRPEYTHYRPKENGSCSRSKYGERIPRQTGRLGILRWDCHASMPRFL